MSEATHQAAISNRPRFKRRGSILLTLVGVLSLVALAPLVFVASRLIVHNREALSTVQQQYQLLLVTSISRELDTYVDGLRSETGRLAHALGSVTAWDRTARSEEIRKLLEDAADDRMLCLHYDDLRGSAVESRSAVLDGDPPTRLFKKGFAAAAEMLADGGEDAGHSTWISPPLVLGTAPARAAVVVSSPVVSGGAFRGVLSVVVDLQPAWERAAAAYQGYTIFALDPSGQLFATNNAERLPLDTDLSRSDLVESFHHSAALDVQTVPFTWKRNGREDEYIGTWLKTRQGWGVFVQAESRLVYWSVRHMIRTTRMWALLALSLALVAAVLMARGLSRPIRRLATASRQFAAGDFSTRVPVKSRNEIGELADTFNLMASELEEYIRELRELFDDTITALTAAIDAKDPYTRGHSERVNAYAVIIATYMGLTKEQQREIHYASQLHDVGKIAIRDSVLGKQGPLTAEEFEEMKKHTVRGESIMAPIRQMRNILPGLRNHHERWAGGGYPDGLKGDDIPLMARIIAVADTFDATTTERPYQRAMTFEQAKNRINELKGIGLDPGVVDAFNRAFDAGEFLKVPRESAPALLTTA